MHVSGVSKETVIATVFFFAPTNTFTLLKFQTPFYCIFAFFTKRLGSKECGHSSYINVCYLKKVTISFNMEHTKEIKQKHLK